MRERDHRPDAGPGGNRRRALLYFAQRLCAVAVAHSVRAPVCGTGGSGFESRQPPFKTRVFGSRLSSPDPKSSKILESGPARGQGDSVAGRLGPAAGPLLSPPGKPLGRAGLGTAGRCSGPPIRLGGGLRVSAASLPSSPKGVFHRPVSSSVDVIDRHDRGDRLSEIDVPAGPIWKILTRLGEPLEPPPVSPARGPPTDWGELVQVHDDRDVFQERMDELPMIDIHSLRSGSRQPADAPVRRRSAPMAKNRRFRGGPGPGTAPKPARHAPLSDQPGPARDAPSAKRRREHHWPGYPLPTPTSALATRKPT